MELGEAEIPVFLAPTGKGRKKLRNKENWKKNQAKKLRHISKGFPDKPKCQHNLKSIYKCGELTMQDIRRFHQQFYASCNKITQDMFILKHCKSSAPKRVVLSNKTVKNTSNKYFVRKKDNGAGTSMIQVCQTAFLGILSISKFRVQRICRDFLSKGELPAEKRGGDTMSKKYEATKTHVMRYIESLATVETHYCRNVSKSKQYLTSHLNIKILFKSYNNMHPNKNVKYDYFRKIFVENFNLSFKTPATDVCSRCLNLKEHIKSSLSQREKLDTMTQYRIHILRAKAFFQLLRESNDDELVISFDCQKNMVLPKIPDQSTYFSRQLYLYNFTICQGTSKSKQTNSNTFVYTWLETENGKGSNEIVSCVYHHLTRTNIEGIKHIKLFCDGCGGQNKNRSMIAMLCKLLNDLKDIEDITLIFPTPGHSFIPPDRIFGNIERIVRRRETILEPIEYRDIFGQFGTVFQLNKDVKVFDWKKQALASFKAMQSWHFQFSATKRFIFTRNSEKVLVRGEPNYRNDVGIAQNIFKRNKCASSIKPTESEVIIKVKKEKLNDVKALLTKHFGEKWEDNDKLQFYKQACNTEESEDCGEEIPSEEEFLLNIAEPNDLRI